LNKTRLEAFSDGVIAILITIMVLELRIPEGADWDALQPIVPVFITYILSFVLVGIYWNNHHHLMHAADRITGGILWANLHLLFWLSLIPFSTGWMGRNNFAPLPTAVYGAVLLLAAIAYTILARMIIAAQGPHSRLKEAIGSDAKGYGVACHVRRRHSARVHESVARLRPLRHRRADLVHSRSAHRAPAFLIVRIVRVVQARPRIFATHQRRPTNRNRQS
jgi:uncharacterized membrane protein